MASVSAQQAQQEQEPQDAVPGDVPAEGGEAEAVAAQPAPPMTFLARRKLAVALSIGTRAKFIVLSQLCMAIAALWSAFGLLAFWGDQESCEGSLFSLKSWFLGAFAIQCMYILSFLVTMCFVIYVTYSKTRRARVGDEDDAEDLLVELPDCFIHASISLGIVPMFACVWVLFGVVALSGAASDGDAYKACSYGHEFFPFWALLEVIFIWCCGTYFILDAHGARGLLLQPRAPAGTTAAVPAATPAGTTDASAPAADDLLVAV